MSMITNQHFADVDDSDIKSERQRQLKGQYLQGFKEGVESQREFCTGVLEKIRSEIEQNAYPIVHGINDHELGMTLYGILQVIDKYRESEEKS